MGKGILRIGNAEENKRMRSRGQRTRVDFLIGFDACFVGCQSLFAFLFSFAHLQLLGGPFFFFLRFYIICFFLFYQDTSSSILLDIIPRNELSIFPHRISSMDA
jgi:hypothetical protein